MKSTGTLEVTLPSEREIAMKRVFDAPRELVFEAYVTPELLKRWRLGPPGWSMTLSQVSGATRTGSKSGSAESAGSSFRPSGWRARRS